MNQRLVVIGIGDDGPGGLGPEARAHIERARVLAGGTRQLAFFPDFTGEKIILDANLDGAVLKIRERYPTQATVVLASGDPLFHGIGKTLLEHIPKDDILFFPHVSSVQLAFAALKMPWHDASIVSLHGRPIDHLEPVLRRKVEKIAVLTDPHNHPAAIARFLIAQGRGDDYTLWVCEHLGGPAQRITRWRPSQLGEQTFAPLNVVVLLAVAPAKNENPGAPFDAERVPLIGIPDAAFVHRGLITRREVRLAALAQLDLRATDVLWDVGAGSGSVSIEVARLSASLRAFAIERSAEAIQHIEANVQRFGSANVQIVSGEAPEAFAGLPDPDAVFIGGSGGRLADVLRTAAERLRPGGRLVLNCVTLETLTVGWDKLRQLGLQPTATSIQLAHSRPLGKLHCFEPEHPIFILRAVKP